MKEKQEKPLKEKPPKEKGQGRAGLTFTALVLALLGIVAAVFLGVSGRREARKLTAANDAVNKKIAALEEDAALEKNREKVLIQMEPHSLAAYMADSAFLYKTSCSAVRYETGPEPAAIVRLRVPVTVTIYNNSQQTITVTNAALYPWETIFEETALQETLAEQQKRGFFGELSQGTSDRFSIAPGQSQTLELDARLRGVYGHPALEVETHRFFQTYFGDPEHTAPDPGGDVTVKGKGTMNGRMNTLFGEALAYYCDQRNTRFTLTYAIDTARGNTFSATCAVAF